MKTRTTLLAIAAACALCTSAQALYSLSYTGDWPKTWPRELEPLRKQSRTLVGPMVEQRHFAIRFNSREEFEAAWPHLLKVKTKNAPVFLLNGPSFFLGDGVKAGVIVHAPPVGQSKNPNTPEAPIAGVENPHVRWMNTTYIDLVVDGDVIDPARLKFPKNTPVIDERSAKPG
jgi:hypothetical protein